MAVQVELGQSSRWQTSYFFRVPQDASHRRTAFGTTNTPRWGGRLVTTFPLPAQYFTWRSPTVRLFLASYFRISEASRLEFVRWVGCLSRSFSLTKAKFLLKIRESKTDDASHWSILNSQRRRCKGKDVEKHGTIAKIIEQNGPYCSATNGVATMANIPSFY